MDPYIEIYPVKSDRNWSASGIEGNPLQLRSLNRQDLELNKEILMVQSEAHQMPINAIVQIQDMYSEKKDYELPSPPYRGGNNRLKAVVNEYVAYGFEATSRNPQ
jgi:hypothetical protein